MIKDEKARIDSLKLYRILDTATETAFDDLTRLASTICETPISLVSLVDDTRQWFKAHHGLERRETPREQAFCAHALYDDQLLIVEDALRDERFALNPLVTAAPNIRFYAGAPLRMADGAILGTLCVIDLKPRELSDGQKAALGILRDSVVAQIELRRAIQDLVNVQKLVPMCAWCRRVSVEDNGAVSAWVPLHDYVAQTSSVTHGMCPNCKEDAVAELAQH